MSARQQIDRCQNFDTIDKSSDVSVGNCDHLPQGKNFKNLLSISKVESREKPIIISKARSKSLVGIIPIQILFSFSSSIFFFYHRNFFYPNWPQISHRPPSSKHSDWRIFRKLRPPQKFSAKTLSTPKLLFIFQSVGLYSKGLPNARVCSQSWCPGLGDLERGCWLVFVGGGGGGGREKKKKEQKIAKKKNRAAGLWQEPWWWKKWQPVNFRRRRWVQFSLQVWWTVSTTFPYRGVSWSILDEKATLFQATLIRWPFCVDQLIFFLLSSVSEIESWEKIRPFGLAVSIGSGRTPYLRQNVPVDKGWDSDRRDLISSLSSVLHVKKRDVFSAWSPVRRMAIGWLYDPLC